jgi:hypothetical protein
MAFTGTVVGPLPWQAVGMTKGNPELTPWSG